MDHHNKPRDRASQRTVSYATAALGVHELPSNGSNDHGDRHAGGATVVEVGAGERQAWVAVEDAGHGVPDDQHALVFARFPLGTGGRDDSHHLGLALSRQNARLAGGDVIVQDRPEGSARLVLLLPLASAP